MGINILLAIKPGASLTTQGILSMVLVNATIVSVTDVAVASPLIISTSFIMGTGFIKCIPITSEGLLVAAANCPIEIEEVLVASIQSALVCSSKLAKIFFLISLFSVAASMTKSALATPSSIAVKVLILARVITLFSAEIICLVICLSKFFPMVAIAFSKALACASIN